MGLDLSGIENVGEFYSHHYLEAVLGSDLQDVLKAWAESDHPPYKRLARLESAYFKARHQAGQERSAEERWRLARGFHAELLEALGYPYQPEWETLPQGEVVPTLLSMDRDGRPFLWMVDAPFPLQEDESPLDSAPVAPQATEQAVAQGTWRELLDGPILRQESPPRWVLFMGGDEVLLIDAYKWPQGKYLRFGLADLFSRRQSDALKATAALLHRDVLNPEDGTCRHDLLDESNHKHAYAVSADLKYGARQAIERLGNEAVHYLRTVSKVGVFNHQGLERQLTDECLSYLYRLLFLFYVEARGPELGIAPMQAEAYREGYSLERLRDLELVPLTTPEAQNGYYLHHSLELLFQLVQEGFPPQAGRKEIAGQLAIMESDQVYHNGFWMPGVGSALFDPARTPLLRGVKFRNCVLQEVLQLLSLSKEGKRKERGRISYAQLGINQLGSVYEGLLSYSGFFAGEDLYEVRSAKELKDEEARTFFVPFSKIGSFDDHEIVKDDGRKRVHPKGTYLFRLSGREREKSASYYTPEVLTRCVTRFTLKERLEGLSADEILELTVCEPAMGSGAFLNEAVNQLADAYLLAKQKELGQTIPSDQYPAERARVKYHFAAHNCYGVDKNPRALELAKLSLWLNALGPGVQTPYLDLRLATGDSLIGARRALYHRADLVRKASKKAANWQGMAPERKPAWEKGWVYHFLVPYSGMADFEKDKAVKELEPEAMQAMKAWRKAMAEPFSPAECDSLERISARLDELWARHAELRAGVLRLTRQPIALWGQPEAGSLWRTPAECQQESAPLFRPGAPGQRLAAVMDYWCALWFWPLDQAELLPGRDEWLLELDAILDGDLEGIFALPRFQVVRQVTERVRFVHWELQFAEAFSERGGFDLILGNPPWVKVEWNEGGVLGDIAPELVVRGVSASEIAKRRAEVLEGTSEGQLYYGEYQETIGTSQFLNSSSNYPLLAGQQTNLYKCFLVRNWELMGPHGFEGLVHQPGPFDDPKGGVLRAELSRRLRWVWLYINQLKLFDGVGNCAPYCASVTGNVGIKIDFRMVSNLVHPRTIDESESHDGFGIPPGVKNEEDDWELRGHRSRIIEVDDEALKLFASLYDKPGTPALEARLPVVHSREILSVLHKFAAVPRRLGDLAGEYYSTECFHETNHQKDGTIRRETRFPVDASEWIVSGPHFYVGTPFAKTPNDGCANHRDYAPLDLTSLPDDYLPRTNYVPACDPEEFRRRTPHWRGKPVTDYYRHVHREMVAPTGERTLAGCIIPPGVTHVHTVFGIVFSDARELVLFNGLAASLAVDFFVKSTGMGHINQTLASVLPLTANEGVSSGIAARTLRLNCLTTHYADLWRECWDPAFEKDSFTKADPRLGAWSHLAPEWHRHCAVRTPYERRQCLVELDALAALALDLTIEELCTIYRVQFPVLRMYEKETFYDQRGMIVFTTNRGLPGVGLTRAQFEEIKNAQPGDTLPDDARQYIPPFDRCDREADMTQAYQEFQKRLAAVESAVPCPP
jgi:hypothetical protein